MRDDKRRGRGAALAVIEASSRVQGPVARDCGARGQDPIPVTPEESHARFLTIAAAVSQGAERVAHMNAVDRARAARGDSTTVRSAGAVPALLVRSMLDVEKDLVLGRTGSASSQFLAPDWPLTPGNVSPIETLPNPSPC